MIRITLMMAGLFTLLLAGGCSSYRSAGEQQNLEQRAQYTIQRFQETDPSINRFLDNSAGFAVFPEVAKGGAGIGGAHGDGVVYENGVPVGTTTLKQGSIGFQLGGQTYSEIIFFETERDLAELKSNQTEFSAQASAVAAARGSAANADYSDGVAIFVADQQGLMFEAAVGGQKFTYRPMADDVARFPDSDQPDSGM